jgi:hypothetical protein
MSSRASSPSPANPVKETDTRTEGHRERFDTDECWELDALSPTVIANLIRTELDKLIDRKAWDKAEANEERGCKLLDAAAANWTKVEAVLRQRGP